MRPSGVIASTRTPSGSDSPSRSLRMLMNTNRFAGLAVVHVQVEPQFRKLRALREHLVARWHDAGAARRGRVSACAGVIAGA